MRPPTPLSRYLPLVEASACCTYTLPRNQSTADTNRGRPRLGDTGRDEVSGQVVFIRRAGAEGGGYGVKRTLLPSL